MVLEFPNTGVSYDQILWSQQLNGKLAALDKDGNTDVLSFAPQSAEPVGKQVAQDVEPAFARPIPSAMTGAPYTPKWMQPKGGACWGFGGKLVTFQGKCLKVVSSIRQKKEQDVAAKV